jgi:NADPH2:quinone reductase
VHYQQEERRGLQDRVDDAKRGMPMKAGIATENGLEVRDVEAPVPADEQVLVRVRAAALNRADLHAARGAHLGPQAELGKPIGMECAGEVVEVGKAVTGVQVGDRVACSGPGCYAEYAVADHGRVYKLADSLSFEDAAVLPVALATAHDALVTNGLMRPGSRVLIHGASSGVGLAAMRIARLLGAGFVAGTSSNAERRARLAEFGADLAVDSGDPTWPDAILAATGGEGVNVTVDMITGAEFNATMRASALRARIVNVGRLGGNTGVFDHDFHALRRLEFIGVTFRTRTLAEVREIVKRVKADVWAHVESGALRLPVDARFPLSEAPRALEHMRTNKHFGKIVLIP